MSTFLALVPPHAHKDSAVYGACKHTGHCRTSLHGEDIVEPQCTFQYANQLARPSNFPLCTQYQYRLLLLHTVQCSNNVKVLKPYGTVCKSYSDSPNTSECRKKVLSQSVGLFAFGCLLQGSTLFSKILKKWPRENAAMTRLVVESVVKTRILTHFIRGQSQARPLDLYFYE